MADVMATSPELDAPEASEDSRAPPDRVDRRRLPPPPSPGASSPSPSESSSESPRKPEASSPNPLLRSCRSRSWYCGWSSVADRNLCSAAPSGIHSKEPGCVEGGSVLTGAFQSCTTRSVPARNPRGLKAAPCNDGSNATPSQVKSFSGGARCWRPRCFNRGKSTEPSCSTKTATSGKALPAQYWKNTALAVILDESNANPLDDSPQLERRRGAVLRP